MTRKFTLMLLALATTALVATGCGSDSKDEKSTSDAPAATQTDTAADDATATDDPAATDDAGTQAAAIDEESLRAFIDAINEDPTIVCDADNATAELLEQFGGVDACKEAAGAEEPGKEYTIDDLQIDGADATATITDDEGTTTATFVQEGDQLKISGSQ